jgi:hypothetical protein
MRTVTHYYNIKKDTYRNAPKGGLILEARCCLIRRRFSNPKLITERDLENDRFTRKRENVTCSTCRRHLGLNPLPYPQ